MTARVLSVVCCLLFSRAAAAPTTAAAAAAVAAPAAAADDVIKHSTLLYTAGHEVTSLGVIFGEKEFLDKILFFIEADVNEQGERIDHGLYALKRDVKTKLLDNARDIVVVDMATAYFAAKDGIYLYDKKENAAKKYGSVSDEVISLAAENGTGTLYYLNGQHQLYKVTEDGAKATVIDAIKDAEEIVVDYTGHLYYYTADKKFYVYDGRVVKQVENIPENMTKVSFVKTPRIAGEYALVLGDGLCYGVRDARAGVLGPQFAASAVSADAGLLAYFARERRIYEYNVLAMMMESVLKSLGEELQQFAQNLKSVFNTFPGMMRLSQMIPPPKE